MLYKPGRDTGRLTYRPVRNTVTYGVSNGVADSDQQGVQQSNRMCDKSDSQSVPSRAIVGVCVKSDIWSKRESDSQCVRQEQQRGCATKDKVTDTNRQTIYLLDTCVCLYQFQHKLLHQTDLA